MDDLTAKLCRSICRERCSYRGEPPCFEIDKDNWPPQTCDEPGCEAYAMSAIAALTTHDKTITEPALLPISTLEISRLATAYPHISKRSIYDLLKTFLELRA